MEAKTESMTPESSDRDPSRIARNVIHRCNNFLSLLVIHGENALLMKDAAAAEAALRTMLQESKLLEADLRRSRKLLGD